MARRHEHFDDLADDRLVDLVGRAARTVDDAERQSVEAGRDPADVVIVAHRIARTIAADPA